MKSNTLTSFTKLSPITTQSFNITNTSPINSNKINTINKNKFNNKHNSNINKNKPKKPKPKTQPKTKIIKFHKYKKPPNIIKTQTIIPTNNPSNKTPYHIILQQQQLFLQ